MVPLSEAPPFSWSHDFMSEFAAKTQLMNKGMRFPSASDVLVLMGKMQL